MITKGRFAPTPSGPLHEGSLLIATASWLSARRQNGEWWLRIDDLDAARCPPGAADRILQQLEAYGLQWDGTPVYQSQHLDRYRDTFAQLQQAGSIYPCDCTRAEKRARLNGGAAGYDQHCWRHPHAPTRAPAWRLILQDNALQWTDRRLGVQRPTRTQIGDPAVWRQDNIPGYALVCAVDEWAMGITEVVRGEDLKMETGPQVQIAHDLGHTPPRYQHLPLVLDASGRKMSKQNHAAALPDDPLLMSTVMLRTLTRLGHDLPPMLQGARPGRLLAWTLQSARS